MLGGPHPLHEGGEALLGRQRVHLPQQVRPHLQRRRILPLLVQPAAPQRSVNFRGLSNEALQASCCLGHTSRTAVFSRSFSSLCWGQRVNVMKQSVP